MPETGDLPEVNAADAPDLVHCNGTQMPLGVHTSHGVQYIRLVETPKIWVADQLQAGGF